MRCAGCQAAPGELHALMCVYEPAAQPVAVPARVVAYELPGGLRVEACKQSSGPDLWAIRQNGNCYGSEGWEYEPLPSSRDEAFFARCRYPSAEAAIAAAPTQEQPK